MTDIFIQFPSPAENSQESGNFDTAVWLCLPSPPLFLRQGRPQEEGEAADLRHAKASGRGRRRAGRGGGAAPEDAADQLQGQHPGQAHASAYQ